ncbi:MAG: amidohydrolase family protein [Ruminococcus sp.]|nr:amidohydrolase family protein [Ruminococcus sp.]
MIIDTHTHIGTSLGFDMREEYITYMMEEYGIDHCIISNADCATHDHSQNPIPKQYLTDHIVSNTKAISFAKENEGKISVALWVNPYENEKPIEELIKNNRDIICAVKFHPFHSALRFNSEKIDRYIKLAQKYSLPVVTHTGCGECDNVTLVYEVAKKYPDVNFVMVHMGLGTDNTEAIDLISKLPNLYGDTTWVSIESTLRFLEICGDDKIVFGSDAPIDGKDTYLNNGNGDRSLYQAYFNEFKDMVSENTYEKIMYKNAQKLFSIKDI